MTSDCPSRERAAAILGIFFLLNGAEGIEDKLGKALAMGGAGLGLAQNLIQSIKSHNPDANVPDVTVAGSNGQPDSPTV